MGGPRHAHRAAVAPSRWRTDRSVKAAGALLGLAVLAGSSWLSTTGAFTASRQSDDNSFEAGTVSVADDGTGTALIVLTGVRPGGTATRCIDVAYTGSLTAASIRLYSAGYQVPDAGVDPDGLAPYVTLTIERRSGASATNCSDFAGGTGTAVFSGDASVLGATATSYATGVGSFTPAIGSTHAYRITTTVRDEPGAQAQTMSLDLVWEAQR